MNLNPTNQGIRDFLALYCRRESPKYAVMINGEWGAGKTWLVNEVMKQEGLETFRISLFGISTKQEVYDQFFAQCHPMLASAGTRVVAGIAKGILSRVTFPIGSVDMQPQSPLESLGLKELLINIKGKIVVLDDFERCRLPVKETLGLISNLLDEDECKVIIVSNDNMIKNTIYGAYKEKVVAYTFTVEPETERALNQFWNIMDGHHLNDKSASEIKEIIGMVHDQSGYKNLRHLKISLEGFERLFSCLPDAAKDKSELVKELIYIHSIFSYEVLHGDISGDQVIRLFSKLQYGSPSDSQPSEIEKIGMLANKYRPSKARDLILDSDTWINLFAKGSLNQKAVQNSIESSRFFIDERTPAWRKILEVWSISDDELRELLAQLQKDIEGENFQNVGQILHITGILLWLNKMDLYPEPPERIAKNSISLLTSLDSKKILECRPRDRLYSNGDKSFADIVFFERDNPSFQEVLNHAKTIEKKIHQANLKDSATVLMGLLPNDISGFCRQIVHAHFGDQHSQSGLYADEPILGCIDSSKFVRVLMGLQPMSFRDLLYGIAKRYKHPEITRMLTSEIQWLENVNCALKKELGLLDTSLKEFQLKNAINEYIIPSIENLKEARKSIEAQ